MTGYSLKSCPPIMDEWPTFAACRDHPCPDMWFPDSGSGKTAKRICIEECAVRWECGTSAVRQDERWGIAAGFRCTDPEERAQLREWLGLPAQRGDTIECRECGARFETRRRNTLCPRCRDCVDAAPVREHVLALRAAKVSWLEIAIAASVAPSTVRGLKQRYDGTPWRTIARDKAERIMALPVPKPRRLDAER